MRIWLGFPLNAVINLFRGYSIRDTYMLYKISYKIEKKSSYAYPENWWE